MTTSRPLVLALLLGVAAALGAQSLPKDLPWAVAALDGQGEWTVGIPQLLVRNWGPITEHRLSETEKQALRRQSSEQALRTLDQQSSRLRLDLDRKRLVGPLPPSEPAATLKALADAEANRQTLLATADSLPIDDTLPLRAAWPTGREGQPWERAPRSDLLADTKASYLITGHLRSVGDYLFVALELYSAIEDRVVSRWEGQFAVDEAPARVLEASDQFRTVLLGRAWAGLSVSSPLVGAKVQFDGVWHTLPWSSDDLSVGSFDLVVRNPGRQDQVRTVALTAQTRTTLSLDSSDPSVDPIVIETVPPGIPLYVDSRYVGLSPQTIDRPLATVRVRAQDPAWATLAWEIGPDTISPSIRTLAAPSPAPSVPQAKDHFYESLAVFSVSLTSSAFLGAWREEQVKLTNAYAAAAGADGAAAGYYQARDRYNGVTLAYSAAIVLTSAVFVWMMVELGDYLGAAQTSLP